MKNKVSNSFSKVSKKKQKNNRKGYKKNTSKTQKRKRYIKTKNTQKGGDGIYKNYFEDYLTVENYNNLINKKKTYINANEKPLLFHTVDINDSEDLYNIEDISSEYKNNYDSVKITYDAAIEEHRLNTQLIFDKKTLDSKESGSFYYINSDKLTLHTEDDDEYNLCHYYFTNIKHNKFNIYNRDKNMIFSGNHIYHICFKDNKWIQLNN